MSLEASVDLSLCNSFLSSEQADFCIDLPQTHAWMRDDYVCFGGEGAAQQVEASGFIEFTARSRRLSALYDIDQQLKGIYMGTIAIPSNESFNRLIMTRTYETGIAKFCIQAFATDKEEPEEVELFGFPQQVKQIAQGHADIFIAEKIRDRL